MASVGGGSSGAALGSGYGYDDGGRTAGAADRSGEWAATRAAAPSRADPAPRALLTRANSGAGGRRRRRVVG
ncbi:Os07g0214700 [Oryza sativa Japonica Group]|uniref:Os07g0214700 protein n=1 Tax=Oryza sativa subsp. japonica TaxID=39947 RepID=A0A0P0X3T3_ORYSJ|nr:Os07g0214700 [Oryza sativa Japonica Group]